MTFVLYFKVKGKPYRKEYETMNKAESAKLYVKKRGATEIEIKVRINNES